MPRVFFFQDDGFKAAAAAKVGRNRAAHLEKADSVESLALAAGPEEAFLVVVNLQTDMDVIGLITELETRGFTHFRVLGVLPNADAVIQSPLSSAHPERLSLVPLAEMPMRVENTLPDGGPREDTADWVKVKLLARLQPGGESAEEKRPKIFANILQLGKSGCLLESSQSLNDDATHGLSFFIPGAGFRAELGVQIARVVDAAQLHYAVRFADLSGECASAIADYIQKRSPTAGATQEAP
jgi:hypothetical protein